MTEAEGGAVGDDDVVDEVVPAALDGERLDRVVAMLTGASRAVVADQVADGRVRVNGEAVTSRSHRVVTGDLVAAPPAPAADDIVIEPDASVAFEVVFEDADLIVVAKPPGLVDGHAGQRSRCSRPRSRCGGSARPTRSRPPARR
jgi:23S rRNA-/tRNA-specific pseudouridylate synthase